MGGCQNQSYSFDDNVTCVEIVVFPVRQKHKVIELMGCSQREMEAWPKLNKNN